MTSFIKPMLPTLVYDIPDRSDWVYEVKYDGFRAIIYMTKNEVAVVSRNLRLLNEQFPELISECKKLLLEVGLDQLTLDGELCVLESKRRANFTKIQTRGRLKKTDKIMVSAKEIPISFLAFDVLSVNQSATFQIPFIARKQQLLNILDRFSSKLVVAVTTYDNEDELWSLVRAEHGEGIIAKKRNSFYSPGARTKDWLKKKNMLITSVFVVAYDYSNSFFTVAVVDHTTIKPIAEVGQGFTSEEKEALIAIVENNQTKKQQSLVYINPSIVIEVEFLELSTKELRHPKFRRFRLDKSWEDCTWQQLQALIKY